MTNGIAKKNGPAELNRATLIALLADLDAAEVAISPDVLALGKPGEEGPKNPPPSPTSVNPVTNKAEKNSKVVPPQKLG